MNRTARVFRLLAFCLFTVSIIARAQDYLSATGNPTFSVNIPIENGFINLANGNLHMEFPLATHQQRGALSLNERIVYDSRIWMIGHYSNSYWWPNNIPNTPNTQGGWRFVTGNETGSMSYSVASYETVSTGCSAPPYDGSHTRTTLIPSWSDPSGATHIFDATLVEDQDDCNFSYTESVNGGFATDASGYAVRDDGNGHPVVTDNKGTQVYPQVIDRFGNYWSSDANGNLIDDLGRTPVIVTKSGSVTYYDVLAPNGPINNNGTRVRYTVTTAPISVQTHFNKSGVIEWPADGSVGTLYPVQSIQLPDGSSYSFTYDSYGEITSVSLPTHGVVTYGWSNYFDACQNGNRWLTSRTPGSDPATTFTPAPLFQCTSYPGNKVTLHEPSGNEKVYEFVLTNGAWNSSVIAYNGSEAGDQQIVYTDNGYYNLNSGINVTKSSSTTRFSNGVQSVTEYSYDDPWLGRIGAVKEWNYSAAGTAGTLSRETDYSYSGYDLTAITVKDGNGTQVAQTTYDYTTSASGSPSAPQHGSANAGGPYLHAVTRWLNGGTSPVTTYSTDDTGTVSAVIDPRGNTTTITYQCGNALQYQSTNALGHTTTYGYDCNSGAITSVKDPNDAAVNRSGTTYQYEATAGRLQSISYPDGGQTTYSYPSSSEVDTSVVATPNPIISSQDIADSLGRPYQHIQGGVSVETTYDTSGRVNCTTNPHFTSSSSSTDGRTCITSYDGLGRPLVQSQPDGTPVSWSYNGNTVTNTDEAGHSWQRTNDAFGNLTKVVEPGGLNTTYQYDALGNLHCVDQWETNSPGTPCTSSHYRQLVYDSLSRLNTSINKEAGTVGYSYDPNGNVHTRADNRGVVTTYSYDALNRVTNKNYSDGVTPNMFYFYDIAPGWMPDLKNTVGRLTNSANSFNGGASSKASAAAYSYDAMGRVVREWVQTPTIAPAGYYVSSSYDLAGNQISLTYPDGRTISQGFDGAGRTSSVNYANWNGNGKTYSYLGNTSYDPGGHLISAAMGNGVGLAAEYDSRERINHLFYGTSTQFHWGKSYQWTPNSNLQAMTDPWTGVQRQFTYDNLNRLTSAQDIVGSFPGASMLPPGSSSTGAPTGATPVPQWTNPDDSNVLLNPEAPGASGWSLDTNVTYQGGIIAPDGTPSATNLIAVAGSNDAYAQDAVPDPSRFSGETMMGSVWLRSPNGPHTVALYIVETVPGTAQIAGWKTVTVSSSWQQFHISAQVAQNLQGLWLMVGGAATIANGQTISIWNPMMEDSGTSGATVTNFLPYSQRLTASTWVTTTTSIADNSGPAPDGSNTAATITATDPTDSYVVGFVPNPAPLSGLSMTASVWLRSPNGPKNLYINMVDIASGQYQVVGATVVSLTTDWQRFQIGGTNYNTLSQLALQIGGAATFQTGAVIQAWGAQMELASVAGPYIATGATGVSAGTSLTNILPYSQQPSGPSWIKAGAAAASNASVAPDGTGTGYRVTVLPGQTDVWVTDDVTHPALYNSATVTGSIFLRTSDAPRTISLSVAAESSSGRTYLGMMTVPLTSTWHRFAVTGQLPNGLNRIFLQVGGGGSFSSGQSVDLWGAQMEMASSAGPYVETSALPVVAGQELTNILPNSQQLNGPGWGQQHGSISVNTATAPDGTVTAATLTADPTADDAYVVNMVPNPSLYDSETVTASVYLRVPSGTHNVMMYLANIGDQGWNIQASSQVSLTTDWQRFSVTGTNQNGLTNLYLQIGGSGTIQNGQSIQIWGSQMTVGSAAAPYTPTPPTGGTINVVTGQPATLVTTGLNQSYQYDSFGNILQNGSFNSTYTANNQMFGYAYDAAGNLLSDGLNTYTWDAEGRMLTGGGATYVYDADGNRVATQGVGVADTIYFGGVPVARYSAGSWTDLVYGPQGLIAEIPGTENGSPTYRVTDHLGTNVGSLLADGTFTNPLDHTPFGQVFSGSTDDPYQYTGLERDRETNLDHAQFRQYSSTMGRWYAPDPYNGSMDLANPQSLNRYSYVLNNPLMYVDPSGLYQTCYASSSWTSVSIGDGADSIENYGDTFCIEYSDGPEGTVGGAGGTGSSGVPSAAAAGAYTAPNNTISQTPYPPNTPKTPDQCSIYNNGTASGSALYKLCQTFPNNPKSNQMRGCLQSLYSPQSGYIPLPVLIPTSPGSWFDLNSLIPGTGAHVNCAVGTLGGGS